MPYADVDGFRDRVAEASALSDSVIQVALDDAEEFIDEPTFEDKTEQAHVYRAAHVLAMRGFITRGTPVMSRKAAEIMITYAVKSGDGSLSRTKWGELFLEVYETVTSMPTVV